MDVIEGFWSKGSEYLCNQDFHFLFRNNSEKYALFVNQVIQCTSYSIMLLVIINVLAYLYWSAAWCFIVLLCSFCFCFDSMDYSAIAYINDIKSQLYKFYLLVVTLQNMEKCKVGITCVKTICIFTMNLFSFFYIYCLLHYVNMQLYSKYTKSHTSLFSLG